MLVVRTILGQLITDHLRAIIFEIRPIAKGSTQGALDSRVHIFGEVS